MVINVNTQFRNGNSTIILIAVSLCQNSLGAIKD